MYSNHGSHVAIALWLSVYAALMLAASLFWMARIRRPADFLVGGRDLPFWALAGNLTAGCMGTGVIIGASGLAFHHGWAGSAYPIGLGLGVVLSGLIFAGMRKHHFLTLSEEIAAYYGGNRLVAEFSNLMLFLAELCWLAVQIMGGGAVLAAITGWQPQSCVLIAGVFAAGIALPGGFRSMVYTDILQVVILLSGFAFATVLALRHCGGFAGLRLEIPPSYFSFLGTASYGSWKVASLIISLVLMGLADPGRRLSMYSARNETAARWSMAIAGTVAAGFSLVVGITGMCAFQANPHLPVADSALLWLATDVLPSWVATLVVVAVASGIASCANGIAMVTASLFVRHIFPLAAGRPPRRMLFTARVFLACAFVVCTAVALHAGSIVGFVVKFLPVTVSGLAIVVVLGRFWAGSTWQGALAALVITPCVSIAGMWAFGEKAQGWNNAVIPVLMGAAAHIGVSLLTPADKRSFDEVAQALARERHAIDGGRMEIEAELEPQPEE